MGRQREPDFTYELEKGTENLRLEIWRVRHPGPQRYRLSLTRLAQRRGRAVPVAGFRRGDIRDLGMMLERVYSALPELVGPRNARVTRLLVPKSARTSG